jgi:ABC-2 type transport system permease protein
MKRMRAFIQKEFYHIFRDRRSLLILLGMPVVLVTLFGFAITNEIQHAELVVLDPSKDEMSSEITRRLVASGYFDLHREVRTIAEVEKSFIFSKTKLAIVYPGQQAQDFQKEGIAQVQLLADATDPNTATTLINYASSIIMDYQTEVNGTQGGPLLIQPEVRMLYNPQLKSVFMFVPGVMTVILMLVSAMMTSIAITREKELGTMEVLLVSPLSPAIIVIGKVIPYITLAFFNTIVILLLGTYVFGMPIEGSLVLLLAQCVLFVLTSLALGILISTRTNSQQVAMMISLIALMLPTVLLSGFIFPIESMPWPLQWLSNIIPAKWFIIILKNIMLKGTGMEFIWKETLILVGMTFFFIAASVRNFKIRLE